MRSFIFSDACGAMRGFAFCRSEAEPEELALPRTAAALFARFPLHFSTPSMNPVRFSNARRAALSLRM